MTEAGPVQRFTGDIVTRLRAAGCVFAEDEARLLVEAAQTPVELDQMVERRLAGQPLERVIGWADFCGLRISLDDDVFVPRRRTEFLVDQAVSLARTDGGPNTLVDLCCGSGAVGVAVAARLETRELHAVDIDPAAVRCARRNLDGIGYVHEGDLYEPLPRGLRHNVDILLANLPYVPTQAIDLLPPEARAYEARIALDGGEDGLDIVRRVAAEAGRWLRPGGHVLTETSKAQARAVVELFGAARLPARVRRSDDLDATVVIGTA